MELGQLIEFNNDKYFSSKIMQKLVCILVSIDFDSPQLNLQ